MRKLSFGGTSRRRPARGATAAWLKSGGEGAFLSTVNVVARITAFAAMSGGRMSRLIVENS